jgi:catechol 2,3-dioxygenase-like lactoylglutathione lyase family enzyme
MPKIKHIALSTQDVENTAKFYVETFGMKEVGKVNDPGTRGVFLTDGDINLAILTFKNDAAAGVERGKGFSGREPRRDHGETHGGGRVPPWRR